VLAFPLAALGPLWGLGPACIVMAIVVIDKVTAVQREPNREIRSHFKKVTFGTTCLTLEK
jgi:hypothetical protein